MTKKAGAIWRQRRDPLWRGDAEIPTCPTPQANRSIVRHILFLDGAGRETPYHSTSESRQHAEHFANPGGGVYRTTVAQAREMGIHHISRLDLLDLLKGKGKGDAAWSNALDVLTARRYVEQWQEHLLRFDDSPSTGMADLLARLYTRS